MQSIPLRKTLYGEEDEYSALATGTPMLNSKAPAVSTVITSKQIKAMGAQDVEQVLESVPGIHVSHYYQTGNPIYFSEEYDFTDTKVGTRAGSFRIRGAWQSI